VAELGFNLGSLDLMKQLNIELAEILLLNLKLLAASFKDLIVVSDKSSMLKKFISVLNNENEIAGTFNVQKLDCNPTLALKIYQLEK
jgi:hypothetical protein